LKLHNEMAELLHSTTKDNNWFHFFTILNKIIKSILSKEFRNISLFSLGT
jgi:hypothetical protein